MRGFQPVYFQTIGDSGIPHGVMVLAARLPTAQSRANKKCFKKGHANQAISCRLYKYLFLLNGWNFSYSQQNMVNKEPIWGINLEIVCSLNFDTFCY